MGWYQMSDLVPHVWGCEEDYVHKKHADLSAVGFFLKIRMIKLCKKYKLKGNGLPEPSQW